MNSESNQFNQETKVQISFDAVADDFVKRIRQGEYPSIPFYVEAYPDLKTEIEELFPTLAKLENYDPFKHATGQSVSGFSVPRQFGDYEIIGELGRGGMGIVFEAINNKLKRRVALKVLPLESRNPDLVNRFEREARAAGQLHHTNIVPVFDVGEFEGMHFYSMQCINGQSLDQIISDVKDLKSLDAPENASFDSTQVKVASRDETDVATDDEKATPKNSTNPTETLSSWSQLGDKRDGYFRRVAHVGIQVAKALDYAHRQGVLHRDIKPANLLLDVEGVVWITDFGLAKDGKVALTHTGDIIGTLRYMAPERFNGHSDARSDVYSLGLTLYELCTLKYAYDQSDRAQLIKKLQTQSPVPPRKIRPDIPLDLETIIVKAISHDPSMRYQSASQMVVDLNCFLNDRPVLARRVSPLERLFRWTKRNPLPATVAGLLLMICVIVFSGAIVFARMSNDHAVQLQKENTKVKEEKSRTEEALEKLKSSNRSSKGHLYHAFVGQARSSSISGAQGQNYQALSSAKSAAKMVRELKLSEERAAKRYLVLSQVAIKAMGNWDLLPVGRLNIDGNLKTQFSVHFKTDQYVVADDTGKLFVRKLDADSRLTNETLTELASPGQEAWQPVFSNCGSMLAAVYHHAYAEGNTLMIVWDLNTRKELFRTDKFLRGTTFAFSDDGKRIAFSPNRRSIAIYDFATQNISETVQCEETPSRLQFERNNILAVSFRNSSRMEFWETTDSFKLLREFNFDQDLSAFHWAPKLGRLAIACENEIRIFGLDNQYQLDPPTQPVDKPENQDDTKEDDAKKDDGEAASRNEPSTTRNNQPLVFAGHTNKVVQLFLHPSGDAMISTAWDGTTRLYSFEEQRESLRIDGKRVNHSGFDDSGEFIAYSNKSTEIGIWKLPLNRPVKTRRYGSKVKFAQRTKFVPHYSSLLLVPSDQGVTAWNHESNQVVGRLECVPPIDIAVLADPGKQNTGRLYTSGSDGLQVWQYEIQGEGNSLSFRSIKKLVAKGTAQLACHPESGRVAARTSHDFFDVIDQDLQTRFRVGPHRYAAWATFSANGKQLITTTWQGQGIKVWDVEYGKLMKDLSPETSTAIAGVNPASEELIVYSGDQFKTWSTRNWQSTEDRRRENPDGWPGQVGFSPDGKWILASYSRYQTQILDSTTKKRVGILDAPFRCTVAGLQWSSDYRFVLVADSNIIQVWNTERISESLEQLQIDWKVKGSETRSPPTEPSSN